MIRTQSVTMIQVCPESQDRKEGKLRLGGTGCGIISPSQSSSGEPFNAAGGGVFGMLWDGTGIRMCKSPFLFILSSVSLLTHSMPQSPRIGWVRSESQEGALMRVRADE